MEAVQVTGAELARLHAGGPGALDGALRDGFRLFLAGRGFAPSTQITYYKRARGFLKWLIRTDAHPDALSDSEARDEAVLDYLSTVGDATRKVTLAAVRALYEWLELGAVEVDPVTVDRTRSPSLSGEQQSRLLDAAAARSARDYALMVLWLDVGPRPSEIRRLDLGDAELSARGGRVLLTRPDGQQRWAELTQATTWVLLGWRTARATLLLGQRRAKSGPLFITLRRFGRILSDQSLEGIVAEIGADAGIEALTPWMLRTTVKARLYTAGASASEVAARMGQTYEDPPQVRALFTGVDAAPAARRAAAVSGQLSFEFGV
ncbi:tyrosine-type recombinase/integrase [Nocardia sp. NPDC048505]|uniref:site-specific integrase n=1 Tax=Nocardia sp. NPDC048505 TaxID=3155756 RepID=UPI0033CF9DAE